jgi:hypothetical protein
MLKKVIKLKKNVKFKNRCQVIMSCHHVIMSYHLLFIILAKPLVTYIFTIEGSYTDIFLPKSYFWSLSRHGGRIRSSITIDYIVPRYVKLLELSLEDNHYEPMRLTGRQQCPPIGYEI